MLRLWASAGKLNQVAMIIVVSYLLVSLGDCQRKWKGSRGNSRPGEGAPIPMEKNDPAKKPGGGGGGGPQNNANEQARNPIKANPPPPPPLQEAPPEGNNLLWLSNDDDIYIGNLTGVPPVVNDAPVVVNVVTATSTTKSYFNLWKVVYIMMAILFILLIIALIGCFCDCCTIFKQRKQNTMVATNVPVDTPR